MYLAALCRPDCGLFCHAGTSGQISRGRKSREPAATGSHGLQREPLRLASPCWTLALVSPTVNTVPLTPIGRGDMAKSIFPTFLREKNFLTCGSYRKTERRENKSPI